MAYDEETRARAVTMVDEGWRVSDVAEEVGVSERAVRYWCAAAGVVPHAPRRSRRTGRVSAEA